MGAHAYSRDELDQIVDWADQHTGAHVPRRRAVRMWEARQAARNAARAAADPVPEPDEDQPQRGLVLIDCDDICPRCGGSGEIQWLSRPSDPQSEEAVRCPTCAGQGTV